MLFADMSESIAWALLRGIKTIKFNLSVNLSPEFSIGVKNTLCHHQQVFSVTFQQNVNV